MSLAKRLEEGIVSAVRKGPDCDVRIRAADLDQADADALHVLIHKRLDLSAADVMHVLREEGIEISAYTIRRHRRGECVTCRK